MRLRNLMVSTLALAAMTMAAMPLTAKAEPMPFAAHRAAYELALLKSTGRKAPEAVSGRILLEFTGTACEGYITNFRQVTELQPAEGDAHTADMRSTTYEDGEGKSFNFKIETKVDAITTESIDGTASHGSDGALKIKLQKPLETRLERSAGIVFPTEHMRHILKVAREGGKLVETQAYDGSDTGDKVFNTLSVIGNPITTPAPDKALQIDALKNVKRWPVTISYFDAAKPDSPPQYVLSFDLLENGIARALRLDYGDFVLSGEITELTYLDDGACKK